MLPYNSNASWSGSTSPFEVALFLRDGHRSTQGLNPLVLGLDQKVAHSPRLVVVLDRSAYENAAAACALSDRPVPPVFDQGAQSRLAARLFDCRQDDALSKGCHRPLEDLQLQCFFGFEVARTDRSWRVQRLWRGRPMLRASSPSRQAMLSAASKIVVRVASPFMLTE